MQTQGASNLWGGNPSLGLDSNWGSINTPFSSGANNMNLLAYGAANNSLSNNQGHMQSGANSTFDSNRGSWGAPGTLLPSQSNSKMPIGTSSNMQGSLPVSGAQPNGPQSSQVGGAFSNSSQSPGPNGGINSQGNSGFGNNAGFQKISTSTGSSGLAINPATSIMNSSNGSSAQASNDNLGSAGWGMPVSSQDSRLMGTNNWGNPTSADWDQTSSSVSQSLGSISNPQGAGQGDQRPSSWAQAAGRGLNLPTTNQIPVNSMSPDEIQRQSAIRRAIESHEGWGKKQIRQDTPWSIETSPKVQRKISTASVVPEQQQKGTNNMWNNNNGTAIWEANKDNMAWGGNSNQSRAPGQPPSNWPGGQKPPDPMSTNQWSGSTGQTPGPDKNMGGPWPQGGQQGSNAQWSGSTETGSWGTNMGGSTNTGASGGISTWGDAEGTSSWGDSRGAGGSDGTSYWGDPQTKPPVQQPPWSNAPGSGAPAPAAIGQNRIMNKNGNGWGDPMGPPDPKIDDGTSLWQGGPPTLQARAPSWAGGDLGNQAQWNPAVGKPAPKMVPQNPSQYGGVDDLNWNLPKEDVWSEESMGGWDDADMGIWNDTAQQTNSSWNSATGWNREKRNSIAKDGALKLNPQTPHLRSRLLQQLTDMGFKKDDAQRALINNNMDIQGAIADLYRSSGAKKDDFEIARMSGLLPTNDDISDTQPDSNSFVPNLNHMQNTPFNNAQSKIPNQFPFNNGPSLNQSSLGSNNPSINSALQQKFMQKYPTQPPPTQQMNSMNPGQGPLGPGQPPGVQSNPNVHQQMAQQQILNQLRMAVQAGLISPQLLNRQLPTHVLVMLQQLLQHQQNLQQLIHTQLTLQQNKLKINPHMQRQQLEEITNKVHIIKQQILMLQKNISAAQKSLLDKPDSSSPQQPSGGSDNDGALQNDMNNLSLQPTSQPQSRLNQWKKPTPDKESPDGASNSISNTASTVTPPTSQQDNAGDKSDLNKTVGSKPIQQSNPTPNLRRYDELGLPALGGDSTWSSSASGGNLQNWPNSTSSTDNESSDNSESLMTTAASTVSSTSSSSLDPIPTIPEFVPGKPWQGISAKNVEDDPHITPGSFSRSLSVNTVKDDYLLTLTKSSPNSDNNSSWPSKSSDGDHKPWSAGGDNSLTPTSFSSEVWGMHGKNSTSRPPPGLPQQHLQQQQKWAGMNRQHSWAGSATRHDGRGNWGEPQVSTVLCLQNLLPSTDGATLRTLCMQHGPLQHFYLNLSRGEAIVKYRSMEEASKAQKALNNCLLGNTTILANFLSDTEAQQYIEMQQSGLSGGPGASQWSQGGGQQHPRSNLGSIGGGRGGNMGMGGWGGSMNPAFSMSGGSGMWGNSVPRSMNSGGGLWGAMDDNGPHNLLGNMLG